MSNEHLVIFNKNVKFTDQSTLTMIGLYRKNNLYFRNHIFEGVKKITKYISAISINEEYLTIRYDKEHHQLSRTLVQDEGVCHEGEACGRAPCATALLSYYVMRSDETPWKDKLTIFGSLAHGSFI